MQCHGRGCGGAKDHVRLQRHEFRRVGARSLDASRSPTIVDLKIAAFRPTKLLESFAERSYPELSFGTTFAGRHQHAEAPDAVTLRARRERPRACRAAERDQQFPPSDDDCHTPLPREVRKGKDTTPRACCP